MLYLQQVEYSYLEKVDSFRALEVNRMSKRNTVVERGHLVSPEGRQIVGIRNLVETAAGSVSKVQIWAYSFVPVFLLAAAGRKNVTNDDGMDN